MKKNIEEFTVMKCKPIRYIGMLLCAGLLLFSGCTREETFEGPGTGDGGILEGEGFLSLRFHTGDLSALTRAENPGTAEEQRVNAVRIVLYDDPEEGIEPRVKYVFHYNISTNPTPGDGNGYFLGDGLYINGAYFGATPLYDGDIDETQFVTYAQGIVRQDYQMLVIVNPTYEARSTPGSGALTVPEMEAGSAAKSPIDVYWRTRVNQPLSLMTDKDILTPLSQTEILGYGGIADNNDSGNFLMTNEQGLIPIAKENIPTSKTSAHANPFQVTVDRMVAKIIVQTKEDDGKITVPTGAELENVKYLLDRQNRYSFIWRNLNYLKGRYNDDPYGHEATGDNSTRDERYAKTPNFEDLIGEGTYLENYEQNYFFHEPGNTLSNLPESEFKDLKGPASAVPEYVLENALEPNRYVYGNGDYTRVLIRANYWPNENLKGQSYYAYNGKAISQADMTGYRTAVETLARSLGAITGTSGNYTPVDGIFPYTSAGEPAGMAGLFYAIFKVDYYGLLGGTYTGDPLGNGGASFDATDGYGISYYSGGVNYYSAPIRHFDFSDGSEDSPTAGTYGYYGVVRNNIYTVSIRNINGPGSSTPSGSSYISAGVNIQPWGYAGKNIELGQETPVMTYVTYNYYVEDGDTRRLIKTDYDINMAVGATIPVTSLEILNKYKAFANSLNLGVFGDGRILNYPISPTVSLNPEENVVDIEYRELSTYKVTVIYEFEDQRTEMRMKTRADYRGSETILLPDVEGGTPIDLAFLAKHAGFAIRKEPKELAGTDQWFIYARHHYSGGESSYGELPIPSLEEDVEIRFSYLRNEQHVEVTYAYYYEYNNQDVLFFTELITHLGVGDEIPLDATVLNSQLKTVNSLGLGTFLPGTIKTAPDSPTVSENSGKNVVEIRYKQGANPQAYTITLHHWDANNNRELMPPRQITGIRYGEVLSRDYIYGLMSEDPSLSDVMPWTITDNSTTYYHLDSFTIISQGEGTGAPVVYEGVSYSQFPAPIPGNDVHVYFQYAHTYLEIYYYDVDGNSLHLLPGNQYRECRFDVQPGQLIDINSTNFIRDFSAEGYVPFYSGNLPLTISTAGNYFDIRYIPPWNETNVYLVQYGEVLCRVGNYREGETINLDAHIASINQDLIDAGFAGGAYTGYTYTAGIPSIPQDEYDTSHINIFDQIQDTSVLIIMQPNKTKNIAINVELSN